MDTRFAALFSDSVSFTFLDMLGASSGDSSVPIGLQEAARGTQNWPPFALLSDTLAGTST